ncbi:hypothetical protein BLOT_016785 [Blomia tropicalis]|nr:hypothetical protein BLOT_016785 [Blomia tropicalis]
MLISYLYECSTYIFQNTFFVSDFFSLIVVLSILGNCNSSTQFSMMMSPMNTINTFLEGPLNLI